MPDDCSSQIVPWAVAAGLLGLFVGAIVVWALGPAIAAQTQSTPTANRPQKLVVARDEQGRIIAVEEA